MNVRRRRYSEFAAGATLAAALAAMTLLTAAPMSSGSFAAECSASNCDAERPMPRRQGPYFNHVLPADWAVVGENNTTLMLRSRDGSAEISVTGIGGLEQQLTPEVFAYQRMAALGLTDVRFTSVVYIIPMAAYDGAAVMDVTYSGPVGRMRGLVVSNVASIYNGNIFNRTDGTMMLAGANERAWDAYSDWLPEAALEAVHTGPNPFDGAPAAPSSQGDLDRAIEIVAAHRDWVKRTWEELVSYRAKKQPN